jgi:small GTP-binding protein
MQIKTTSQTVTKMQLIQKKICLLGDFAVGKTSLVRRYIEGSFSDKYLSTIGVKISRKTLARETYQLNLIVWDLAGGEEFEGHDRNYLRGASGALLVCDLTRPETTDILQKYARQMNEINPHASMIIAANKADLLGNDVPDLSALEAVCQTMHTQFILTSAKTGENVERVIDLLADMLMTGSDLVRA